MNRGASGSLKWLIAIAIGLCLSIILLVIVFRAPWFHVQDYQDARSIPLPDSVGLPQRVAELLERTRRAVEEDPESPEAWGRFGAALDAHDLAADAAICYGIAHELDSADFRWAYLHAIALEHSGAEADDAARAYEAAGRLNPSYPQVEYRLGRLLAANDQLEAARNAYQRAASIDPSFGPAQRGLGQMLLAHGSIDEAIASLERAVQLMPDDRGAIASLAQAYERSGRSSDAERASDRAARLTGDEPLFDPVRYHEVTAIGISPSACFARAKNMMREQRFAEALNDLQIAEEGMPSNPYVQIAFADALLALSRPADAIAHLTRALEIDEQFVEAQARLARVFHAEGRTRDAVDMYRRALALRPDPDMQTALGIALAQSGQLVEAVREFARAAELSPDDANVPYNWAIALLQLERPDDAAEQLRRTIELDPRHLDAHARLGFLLERAGDVSGAIDHYRRAVAINPNHPAAARLRQIDPSFR